MIQLSTYDDNALTILLKKGDRDAFAEIYRRYWDKLYVFAYSHLRSESATEEMVQEVFFSLWKKKEQLDIELLSAYLATMTRHAVYKRLARVKRQTEVEANAALGLATQTNEIGTMDNRNLLDIIEKLSNLLPEKCRLVFIHNKLLDKSIEEVAATLQISVKTAEGHLTKALKIVRNKIGDMT
ncbi:MAG TPA: sigma-70 family RNA polymerase sigma factor [Puia sp.]|nr:sigma-70 family RNA polymerase sigma factor [Puia sp.]